MQYSDYSEQTPTRAEFRRLAAEGKLTGAAADFLSSVKASEELYDTEADPHQIHNLADDPEHRDILVRLRSDLHRWMIRTRDTGLLPEVEMHIRSAGGSPYDMARDFDRFNPAELVHAADLVGRGSETSDQMLDLLDDSDAGVRYWAATGLGALGADARRARVALTSALQDDAAPVRFTAAEALCRSGRDEAALSILVRGLEDDDFAVRLYAASTLKSIGRRAQTAKSQILAARAKLHAKDPYAQYTGWALARVLSQLE